MKSMPIQFGDIAVQEGYIQSKVLKECLEVQQLYRKPTPVGEIMLEKGLLRAEQVTQILKLQQTYKNRLDSEYLAHLALKRKLITGKQMQNLRRQYMIELAKGNASNLGSLAVSNQYLLQPAVEELIKSPEYQHFTKLKKAGKTFLGGYELVGQIIKLKKTTIYKAIQVELERLVAVKILLPEYESEEYIKKFFMEAQATSRFNHPNLVRIYDMGVEDNGYYYAMELVEGENLADRLGTEGRLQLGETVRVMRQILKALEHIHSFGIIHAEINPRNIVIREDGVAKLLDLSSSCPLQPQRLSSGTLTKMPQYTAPEQVKSTEVLDVRTDIYSLGATFYRMLTGHPPISGKIVEDIRKNILEQEPTAISERDFTIPEELAKIVHRMLRKDPAKRYPEVKNVLFALHKILL
jgi:hypothetical protein